MNSKDKHSLGDLLGLDFPDNDLSISDAVKKGETQKGTNERKQSGNVFSKGDIREKETIFTNRRNAPLQKSSKESATRKRIEDEHKTTMQKKVLSSLKKPATRKKARSDMEKPGISDRGIPVSETETKKSAARPKRAMADKNQADRLRTLKMINDDVDDPLSSIVGTKRASGSQKDFADFIPRVSPSEDIFDLKGFADDAPHDFSMESIVCGKNVKPSENKNDPAAWLLQPKKFRWIMETFRTFKTKLRNSEVFKNKKVFLLTGAEGKVGVSTVTFNLGMIFGWDLWDKKILILDGNASFPSLHKVFSFVDQKSGLLNLLLEEEVTIDRALHCMEDPNIYLMPLGKTKRDILSPFDIDQFNEVLLELKNRFDYIFIDSAPTLWSNHTRILSTKVDGVILVAEANKTRFEVVLEAKRQLKTDGAELIGGFLNKRRFVIPKWIYRFI